MVKRVFLIAVLMGIPAVAAGQAAKPDNDPSLKHSVTPYRWRLSLDAGDQGGGPVRFNTRFPTEASGPNPSSYYHTSAFAGVTGEWAFAEGALQTGVIARQDVVHRGIVGRAYDFPTDSGNVEALSFHSKGASLGWVFGQMYREAPWRVSLATVAEQTSVSTTLHSVRTGNKQEVDVTMFSVSLRSRMMFRLLGANSVDLHLGPEMHIPIYAKLSKPADDAPERPVADLLDVAHTGALGLVLELGLRG